MKKKDLTSLRTKSVSDLEKLLREKREKESVSKALRHEIAQILTLIKELKNK